MSTSLSGIANSEVYQRYAADSSKANIVISTAVAVCIAIFANWGFGFWWAVVIPVLWFAASVLVALPFTLLKVSVVAVMSKKSMSLGKIASGLIDLVDVAVLIAATY